MKEIFFTFALVLGSAWGASANSQPDSVDLKRNAVSYAASEGKGDWQKCYDMLSKAVTRQISFEVFSSRMNAFPFGRHLKDPRPVFQSKITGNGVEVGRVILRDEGSSVEDVTLVAALTLIKEDGEWRVLSVSGLKSFNVIDEMFFSRMIDRESKSLESEP